MTCPFRRASSQHQFANGSSSCAKKPEFRSRQSSFHLPGGPEEDDERNTLTLKNLSEALQLLTAPSNECLHAAVTSLTKNQAEHYDKYNCLRRLPDDVRTCRNYAYLQEIYDAVRATDSVSTKDFMAKLGEYLILTAFSHNCRLERAFKCLGTNLTEFLTTLDSVHDVLHDQDDVLKDESMEYEANFVCTTSQEGKIQLHLTTESEPVAYLLVGSLKAIAKRLYDTQTDIRLMSYTNDPRRFRYEINATPSQQKTKEDNHEAPSEVSVASSSKVTDLKIGVASFCKAFPWHFVVDKRLELVQLGAGFMRLFGTHLASQGSSLGTYFRLLRPRGVTLDFREILNRVNTPFMFCLKIPGNSLAEGLEIKGQMVFCPESDSLLFVGSPFLDGLEGLTGRGLFISDIPLHDATRDVILVGEQARAQDGLRRRMDKLKNSIEEASKAVDKEREKNVSLLHLIFPPHIAKRLWLDDPNPTSKQKMSTKNKLEHKLPNMVPKTSSLDVADIDNKLFENTINIAIVYDSKGHLIHLNLLNNKRIPINIMKVITLIIPYQKNLVSVTINRGIWNNSINEIAKWLTTSYITDLCLDNTVIEDAKYDLLLAKQCSLRQLSLSRCRINDVILKKIASKLTYPLPASKTLNILKLSSNEITDVGAKCVADALQTNRKLAFLNIADNSITDEGFAAILDVLNEFVVPEENILESRRRYVNYLKDRNTFMVQIKQELLCGDLSREVDDKCSKTSKKKGGKTNSAPPSHSSKKSKGTVDLVSVTTTEDERSRASFEESYEDRAKNIAEMKMGKFEDAFDQKNTYHEDGLWYCFGNNVLSYLNVSYNNISYLSVKKLLDVLLKQKTLIRKPRGLVNVCIEGNDLPRDCPEFAEIDQILGENLAQCSVGIQKKRQSTARRESKVSTPSLTKR